MSPIHRKRAGAAALLAAALAAGAFGATGVSGAAEERWFYVIGVERVEQQANFCERIEDVADLAGIFRRYSPRTGYAALSDASGCRTAIHTFTPTAVLDEVIIAPGEDNEYRIRFVEVRMADGTTRFLVTTRDVSVH